MGYTIKVSKKFRLKSPEQLASELTLINKRFFRAQFSNYHFLINLVFKLIKSIKRFLNYFLTNYLVSELTNLLVFHDKLRTQHMYFSWSNNLLTYLNNLRIKLTKKMIVQTPNYLLFFARAKLSVYSTIINYDFFFFYLTKNKTMKILNAIWLRLLVNQTVSLK